MSATFNGIDGYAIQGSPLGLLGDVTFSFWMRTTTEAGGSGSALVCGVRNSTTWTQVALNQNQSAQLQAGWMAPYIRSTSTTARTLGINVPEAYTGDWNQFVFTRSGGMTWFYVNGVERFDQVSNNNLLPDELLFDHLYALGAINDRGNIRSYAEIDLAEFAIFDKVVSPETIAALQERPPLDTPDAGSLLRYWPLKDDFADYGPLGDDLAAHGGTTISTNHPIAYGELRPGEAVATGRTLGLSAGEARSVERGEATGSGRALSLDVGSGADRGIARGEASSSGREFGLSLGTALGIERGAAESAGRVVEPHAAGGIQLPIQRGSSEGLGREITPSQGHALPLSKGTSTATGRRLSVVVGGAADISIGRGSAEAKGQPLTIQAGMRAPLIRGRSESRGIGLGDRRGHLLALSQGRAVSRGLPLSVFTGLLLARPVRRTSSISRSPKYSSRAV